MWEGEEMRMNEDKEGSTSEEGWPRGRRARVQRGVKGRRRIVQYETW